MKCSLVLALSLTASSVLSTLGIVHACGLDGIPSLQVNGRLVGVNRTPPAPGRLSRWAPFVAPGSYRVGQPLLLREITGRVLVTLPPSAFKTPWRWTLGDGTRVQGMSARHVYQHPGSYVVGVRAYLLDGKDSQWYLFDTMLIHVR